MNDFETFDDLREYKRSSGFRERSVEVDGILVDRATFEDTSWSTIERLAEVDNLLDIEIAKTQSKGFRAEVRSLISLQKDVRLVGNRLFILRKRIMRKDSK